MRATRAGKLSLWKGAATAFAVRNAVYATLLAADGMTGPDSPFEGRHGLWEHSHRPVRTGESSASRAANGSSRYPPEILAGGI